MKIQRLTDSQLERAARLFCKRRGEDAEEMVPYDNGTLAYTTCPRWMSYTGMIQQTCDLLAVIAEASV